MSASGRNSGRKGEVKPRPHSRRYQDMGRCTGTNFDPDWECAATREDATPHIATTNSVPPGCEGQFHALAIADRAYRLSIYADIHGQPCPSKLRGSTDINRTSIGARCRLSPGGLDTSAILNHRRHTNDRQHHLIPETESHRPPKCATLNVACNEFRSYDRTATIPVRRPMQRWVIPSCRNSLASDSRPAR